MLYCSLKAKLFPITSSYNKCILGFNELDIFKVHTNQDKFKDFDNKEFAEDSSKNNYQFIQTPLHGRLQNSIICRIPKHVIFPKDSDNLVLKIHMYIDNNLIETFTFDNSISKLDLTVPRDADLDIISEDLMKYKVGNLSGNSAYFVFEHSLYFYSYGGEPEIYLKVAEFETKRKELEWYKVNVNPTYDIEDRLAKDLEAEKMENGIILKRYFNYKIT